MLAPMVPQQSYNSKLDIDLPPGAAPGDKITFSINGPGGQMTTFSAVVPPPATLGMPMKKISVTVPVPASYGPAGQALQISKLFLEKQAPVPQPIVRLTPEQREQATAMQEHRSRIEQHFNRTPSAERHEASTTLDLKGFQDICAQQRRMRTLLRTPLSL